MYQVRTLKEHTWQGKERKPGDVYEVEESDTCVEGARILGLSERVEGDASVQRRRGRYANRATTQTQTTDLQSAT